MRIFKTQIDGGFTDDQGRSIPDDMRNRHRREIADLVATGKAKILPAGPAPAPLTPAQEVARSIDSNRVLKALIAVLSDRFGADIVAEIKAKANL